MSPETQSQLRPRPRKNPNGCITRWLCEWQLRSRARLETCRVFSNDVPTRPPTPCSKPQPRRPAAPHPAHSDAIQSLQPADGCVRDQLHGGSASIAVPSSGLLHNLPKSLWLVTHHRQFRNMHDAGFLNGHFSMPCYLILEFCLSGTLSLH